LRAGARLTLCERLRPKQHRTLALLVHGRGRRGEGLGGSQSTLRRPRSRFDAQSNSHKLSARRWREAYSKGTIGAAAGFGGARTGAILRRRPLCRPSALAAAGAQPAACGVQHAADAVLRRRSSALRAIRSDRAVPDLMARAMRAHIDARARAHSHTRMHACQRRQAPART
jgi:hypothetical protein